MCCCTTERVQKLLLMQPDDTSSLLKPDPSRLYHQQEQRCCSTQNGPFPRVDMCGARRMSALQISRLQSPGGGARVLQKDGNRCGPCSQKQQCPVLSCCDVVAIRDAGDCAIVSERTSSAHHSVTAVAIVTKMVTINMKIHISSNCSVANCYCYCLKTSM